MTKQRKDWAERAAEKIAQELRIQYCDHWNGAYCDICAARRLARVLRRAEKRTKLRELEQVSIAVHDLPHENRDEFQWVKLYDVLKIISDAQVKP